MPDRFPASVEFCRKVRPLLPGRLPCRHTNTASPPGPQKPLGMRAGQEKRTAGGQQRALRPLLFSPPMRFSLTKPLLQHDVSLCVPPTGERLLRRTSALVHWRAQKHSANEIAPDTIWVRFERELGEDR